MRIGSIDPNSKQRFPIQKSISGLLFLASFSLAGEFDDDRAIVHAMLDEYPTLTAFVEGSSGNKMRLATSLSVAPIVEFNAYGKGFIDIRNKEVTGEVGALVTELTVQFYVPFSRSGSILLEENDNLVMEISTTENCEVLHVYGLEEPLRATDILKFNKVNILQGQSEKTIDTSNLAYLMIPRDSIKTNTEFDLHFSNGVNVRMTKNLIEHVNQFDNDIVYGGSGTAVYGYGNFVILDVSAVEKIVMFRDTVASAIYYAVSDVPVENVAKPMAINGMIEDTTEARLLPQVVENIERNKATLSPKERRSLDNVVVRQMERSPINLIEGIRRSK